MATMKNVREKKAQAALELAVFGAILIFVMGTTIRTTLSRSNQQNAILKATRLAMTLSHQTTETKQVSGRNMATVLMVEDRLTAASDKYGSIDRMPFMTQGSAIHSANLFMPIDFGHDEDLPVFDMYVNGKHFAFTAAAFKLVDLAGRCANASPCHADCHGDCSSGSPQYYRGSSDIDWADECLTRVTTTTQRTSCASASPCPPECVDEFGIPDCSASATGWYIETTVTSTDIGCAKLYTIMDNHPLIPQWCDDGGGPFARACPPACSAGIVDGCNLSADERFDLDRDDLDGIPGDVVVTAGREAFSWQWFMVMGVQEDWQEPNCFVGRWYNDPGGLIRTVTSQLRMAEGIVFPGGDTKAKNTAVDVDKDLKIEYIQEQGNVVDETGIIMSVAVQDMQEGDLNFSYNDTDKRRDELLGIGGIYGFTGDVNVYTFVRGGGAGGGTYLQIDEGQLFATSGNSRQFIRTASKKDQVDLVERVWRLSNDTGAFCGTTPGGAPPAEANRIPNPVEACGWSLGSCFTPANINRTCMDVANKLIFIRSRIEDVRGRMWVTDESEDRYVEFLTGG